MKNKLWFLILEKKKPKKTKMDEQLRLSTHVWLPRIKANNITITN